MRQKIYQSWGVFVDEVDGKPLCGFAVLLRHNSTHNFGISSTLYLLLLHQKHHRLGDHTPNSLFHTMLPKLVILSASLEQFILRRLRCQCLPPYMIFLIET